MKHFLYTFILLTLPPFYSNLCAQEPQSAVPAEKEMTIREAEEAADRTLYPDSGKAGIVVNATGLIAQINLLPQASLLNDPLFMLRYVHNNEWTLRLGVSPAFNRFNVNTTDSVGKDLVKFDSTISQSGISLRPGVEYHFKGTNRLDPYVALDGEMGLLGKRNISSVTNVTDTTGTSRMMRTITEAGGYVFGAKLSVGMNYFIVKRMFVGVEYGYHVYGLFSGGDRQEVLQIEPVSGTNTTVRNLSSARTVTTNMLVDNRVQITFGYFF